MEGVGEHSAVGTVGSDPPLFPVPARSRSAELFGLLSTHGVDCVALGGLDASGGMGALVGEGRVAEQVELAIERSLDNCGSFIEAMLGLEATILIDPRRRTPLTARRHPQSLISGEHLFDTAAGRLFLRDPDFILGCRPYAELRADAVSRKLEGDVEVRVASMRDLTRIEQPFGPPATHPEPKPDETALEAKAR